MRNGNSTYFRIIIAPMRNYIFFSLFLGTHPFYNNIYFGSEYMSVCRKYSVCICGGFNFPVVTPFNRRDYIKIAIK